MLHYEEDLYVFIICKKFDFVPDYRNVVMAAHNQAAPRLPLYEHIVGGRMMKDIIGVNPYGHMNNPDDAVRDQAFADFRRYRRTLDYDTASCATSPPKAILPCQRPSVNGTATNRSEKRSNYDKSRERCACSKRMTFPRVI